MLPCDFLFMDELRPGEKIAVYNYERQELGEGTFIRLTPHAEMNLLAYECEEHTILARGDHFLRVAGRLRFISGLASES